MKNKFLPGDLILFYADHIKPGTNRTALVKRIDRQNSYHNVILNEYIWCKSGISTNEYLYNKINSFSINCELSHKSKILKRTKLAKLLYET